MNSYLNGFTPEALWQTGHRQTAYKHSFPVLSNYYCHFHFTGKRWKRYVKIQDSHCSVSADHKIPEFCTNLREDLKRHTEL